MDENIVNGAVDEVKDNKDNEVVTPAEYFSLVKQKKQKMDDVLLQKIYDNCLELLNKYNITGQKQAMKKLMFHLDNIERERELVKMGIDTFVYKSEIEDYIKNVADRVVKICELKDYEREIPDEIVDVIDKTKKYFDAMYVIYTDYTGETERQVEIERRVHDPILFGAFMNKNQCVIVERFYFLGDWEDEYCDLTLDKMVAEVKESSGRNIAMKIKTPEDINELRSQLENLEPRQGSFIQKKPQPDKPNVFKRVVAAIKG